MNPVEKYFNAERWYCAGGIGIGITAITFAAYFFFLIRQPYYSGMAWTLLVLGLFFLIVCVGVFIRSPKDIERVNTLIQTNPTLLQTEELPRMNNVMRNFKVIMIIETGLVVLSIILLFFGSLRDSWKGAFTATLIMAFLLLCFDYLADKRGGEYHSFLKEQIKLNDFPKSNK